MRRKLRKIKKREKGETNKQLKWISKRYRRDRTEDEGGGK